jgi:hypothetical protein
MNDYVPEKIRVDGVTTIKEPLEESSWHGFSVNPSFLPSLPINSVPPQKNPYPKPPRRELIL